MANNVIAQILGGDKKVLDNVATVAEVKTQLGVQGYTATVNGNPAADHTALYAGDYVSLSQAVKGGC